jgi:aspartate aminotransferase
MAINGISNAADFAALMLEKAGIVAVPCADFGTPMHIRLSYACSMEDIRAGMSALRKFIYENF